MVTLQIKALWSLPLVEPAGAPPRRGGLRVAAAFRASVQAFGVELTDWVLAGLLVLLPQHA